jgi:hypothetical protein
MNMVKSYKFLLRIQKLVEIWSRSGLDSEIMCVCLVSDILGILDGNDECIKVRLMSDGRPLEDMQVIYMTRLV